MPAQQPPTTGQLVDQLRDHLDVSKSALAKAVGTDRMRLRRTLEGPRERDKPGQADQLLGACLVVMGQRLILQGEAMAMDTPPLPPVLSPAQSP